MACLLAKQARHLFMAACLRLSYTRIYHIPAPQYIAIAGRPHQPLYGRVMPLQSSSGTFVQVGGMPQARSAPVPREDVHHAEPYMDLPIKNFSHQAVAQALEVHAALRGPCQ